VRASRPIRAEGNGILSVRLRFSRTLAAAFAALGLALAHPVAGAPSVLVTPELPIAFQQVPYSANLMVAGDPVPTSVVVTGLPSGISATHNGSGSVAIAGTPTQSGEFTLTVTASSTGVTLAATMPFIVEGPYSTNVAQVSSGNYHSCVVVHGGVQCWGRNNAGQLGNGSTTSSRVPVHPIPPGSGATAVGAGGDHTCAVVDGGVQCWGANGNGQLGNNSTIQSLVPVQAIPAGSGATAAAAGNLHSCAVVDGAVKCWGGNADGQLGDGSAVQSLVPVQAIASAATSIAAGNHHTCSIVGGGVRCWGFNAQGQLGNGTTAPSLVPVQAIAAGSGAIAIAAGGEHSCAVLSPGGLRCWGSNDEGQLGNGTTTPSLVPTPISLSGTPSSVAAHGDHTCAVVGGGVQCWGDNADGRLGDPVTTTTESHVPVQAIAAGSGATSVATGNQHSCAVAGGGVRCWGSDLFSQLGRLVVAQQIVPNLALPVGSGATAVAFGNALHQCAVFNGGIRCWGANDSGQLGDGSTTNSLTFVVAIADGSGASFVAAGDGHTCAVIGGGVRCWGGNASGQLGIGSTAPSLVPAQVLAAGSGAAVVAGGGQHTCAVVGGGIWCWGANGNGQLGDGSTAQSLVPVQIVAAGGGATFVATGSSHSCAVIDGGVKCWGSNTNGQLGNGSTAESLVPVQAVAPGSGATWVAAGTSHSCAVVNGGVRCWGSNAEGQLANGSISQSPVPIQVIAEGAGATSVDAGTAATCAIASGGVRCWGNGAPRVVRVHGTGDGNVATSVAVSALVSSAVVDGSIESWFNGGLTVAGFVRFPVQAIATGAGATAVAAGTRHGCVLADGGVRCWGSNSDGELGNGSTTNSTLPVQAIAGGSGATALDAGGRHTCAVVNGGVRCWGFNGSGRLGTGNTVSSLLPVQTIAAGSGAVSVATGDQHTCAVANGGIQCWGANASGQLGIGSTAQSLSPAQVMAAGSGATSIAAGDSHTCAVVSAGVQCWGSNAEGQLGNGTTAPSLVPVQAIAAGSGATAVAAGHEHTCAVVNGGVQCWGSSGGTLVPAQVIAAGSSATSVDANGTDTCAVVDGSVQCWGSGDGALSLSQLVALGADAVSVAQGAFHACAAIGGGVACWGDNQRGQLGDPYTASGGKVLAAIAPWLLTVNVAGNGEVDSLTTGAACGATCSYALYDGTFMLLVATPGAGSLFAGWTGCDSADGDRCTVSMSSARTVVATFSQPRLLTVTNSGGGVVTSSPDGIACAPTCAFDFPAGASVTLSAAAASSHVFTGWTGCDSVNGSNQCIVAMSSPRTVGATFVPMVGQAIAFGTAPAIVVGGTGTVSATGGASGNPVVFTSLTAGVCTSGGTNGATVTGVATGTCTIAANQAGSGIYTAALQVTQSFSIGPAPSVVYSLVLEGWQQVSPYVVTPATGTGTATFNPNTKQLTLNLPYSGLTGIETMAHIRGPAARGSNAGVLFTLGAANPKTDIVTLTALQETQLFAGQLYVNIHTSTYGNGELRAQIDSLGATVTHVLTIAKAGAGSGTVTGIAEPGQVIGCGSDCIETVPHDKSVILAATPAGGSTFTGWSGACTGTGACDVTMDADKTVTATFDTSAPPNPPRLSNISTRMQVLTGNDVMIGGFVIGGAANKTVAIVATGPSLINFGITNPLANPMLRLVRSSDQAVIDTNDDWQSHANASQLSAAGFAPSHSLEAAIYATLAPGAYTAIVEGVGGGTGVSVIGVYEVDGPTIPLINISTRGRVLTGNDVMIGGFVIQGSGSQTVAIVASGPSLSNFGITSPLANPTIRLVRSSDQVVIDSNDDWQSHANATQLSAAGFAPSNTLESGIYTTLPPGAYTVVVEGVGGGTGVAVIGVYKAN
jgi:alpha-tubulin suppressor-like RCC1 family protein